jgi:hypothetical protein
LGKKRASLQAALRKCSDERCLAAQLPASKLAPVPLDEAQCVKESRSPELTYSYKSLCGGFLRFLMGWAGHGQT